MFCSQRATPSMIAPAVPYRSIVMVFAMLSLCSTVWAGTFTVDIERTNGSGVVMAGGSVEYVIRGYLSDEDNTGLALFLYDIEVTGGPAPIELATALVQSAGPQMAPFYPNQGFAIAYNGSPVGNDLYQAGGAQNTLRNDPSMPPFLTFPAGPVVDGVGHDPAGVVLHQGTLTPPMDAPSGTYTFRLRPTSLIANMVTAFDGSFYTVEPASVVIGAEVVFEFSGSTAECFTGADCVDVNHDTVRDDNCVWGSCAVVCDNRDIVFGDMGGIGDDCEPDGAADGNDKFHALRCFSNISTNGLPPYLCDPLNVDAGGANLDCCPDGTCDGNDAFAALNAFSGHPNGCTCPIDLGGGHSCPPGAAQHFVPRFADRATLTATASSRAIRSGERVEIEVSIGNAVSDLRGYQLHLGAAGGRSGQLQLVDVSVKPHRAAAFANIGPWTAFNTSTGQMLAGLDGNGVRVPAGAYLATFTYEASADASGTFVVDVLKYDPARPEHRTFLFASGDGMVDLTGSTPAVVVVHRAAANDVR